jgi:hypothetical protein
VDIIQLKVKKCWIIQEKMAVGRVCNYAICNLRVGDNKFKAFFRYPCNILQFQPETDSLLGVVLHGIADVLSSQDEGIYVITLVFEYLHGRETEDENEQEYEGKEGDPEFESILHAVATLRLEQRNFGDSE